MNEDETRIAQAAALYLAAQCGWQRTPCIDRNGVPIVKPPPR
jgi:hypothetical protein